jgi:hypothetical protein
MTTLIEWSAVLTSLAGVLAAVLVLLELRRMDKHKDLEITMKLFEWAETDRLRKALKWVDNEFQFENYTSKKAALEKDSEASDYLFQVEAFFEEVGFMVNKNFVDIDVITDRLGAYIISDWKKLEPWILDMRKERSDKTFGEHFQKLYHKTTSYMEKK